MPARFYKVLVSDSTGRYLGAFSTSSGIGVALLLCDVCHALASGGARLSSQERSALSLAVAGSLWLDFDDEALWAKTNDKWQDGSMKFEHDVGA